MKILTKISKSQVLVFPDTNQTSETDIQACWFDSRYWQKNGSIVGSSRGRHITWFVQPPSVEGYSRWVLRHYYRGGLVAKITKDYFVYTGIKNTRAFKEVTLLLTMLEMDLPVPKPIGARIYRRGIFYTADLLMEKIDAKDLVAQLRTAQLTEKIWNNIGKNIARFHKKGVYHADLNAHNIMLDSTDKVWLIDFDRCEVKSINKNWQQKNIERLERSLVKERGIHSQFYFDAENWQWLIAGYQSL